jgi:hypothetical protein
MKLLFESWQKFLKDGEGPQNLREEKWADYDIERGEWSGLNPDDLRKSKDPENTDITDELFALITTAYSTIGGNYTYKSPEDIPGSKADVWSAVDIDDDPEPDALRVGQTKPGLGVKLSASGHDGTPAGKNAYIANTAELLQTSGHYAEMSKGIAHIMITRHSVPFVKDPEKAQRVLGSEKPITWLGAHPDGRYPEYDGWYTRTIEGKPNVLKIILGKPN